MDPITLATIAAMLIATKAIANAQEVLGMFITPVKVTICTNILSIPST
jgi:hypothetical protein